MKILYSVAGRDTEGKVHSIHQEIEGGNITEIVKHAHEHFAEVHPNRVLTEYYILIRTKEGQ